MPREKELDEFVARAGQAVGANLTALVLYGSGAGGEFHESHSDLNILCLFDRVNAAELARLRPVARWWRKHGHPAPLVFTLAELRDAADIFAIELLEMQRQHRMLIGDDFLTGFTVPMDLHRLQVERELRTGVVHLRQSFVLLRGRSHELSDLMMASSSTFATLFRHSLIALGQAAPDSRRAAATQLAAFLGIDPAGLHTVFDLREGRRRSGEVDLDRTFAVYLDAVSLVAEKMDRHLAAMGG